MMIEGQEPTGAVAIRPCRAEECEAVLALWRRAGAITSPIRHARGTAAARPRGRARALAKGRTPAVGPGRAPRGAGRRLLGCARGRRVPARSADDALREGMKSLHAEYGEPIPAGVKGAEPGEAALKRRYQDRDEAARVAVVERAAANHGEVRLGLGGVIERDGGPNAHVIAWSERALKGRPHSGNGRRMFAPLRLLHHEEAVQQLDPLILLEEALVDEPIILSPGEAAGLDRRDAHALDQRYIPGGRGSTPTGGRSRRRTREEPDRP